MKWGKYLNAVANEVPEWASQYVNYKKLKGIISDQSDKAKERMSQGKPDESIDSKVALLDMKGLACSTKGSYKWKYELCENVPVESLAFFEAVNEEMSKVNMFFDHMGGHIMNLLKKITERGGALQQTKDQALALIQRFEDYSTVNFTAIVKALKKHDKQMNATSQEIYTQNVLIFQKFYTELGVFIGNMKKKVANMSFIPSELVAGADEDDIESIGVQRLQSIKIDSGAYQPRQFRDLNNDVVRPANVKKEAICVPIRGGSYGSSSMTSSSSSATSTTSTTSANGAGSSSLAPMMSTKMSSVLSPKGSSGTSLATALNTSSSSATEGPKSLEVLTIYLPDAPSIPRLVKVQMESGETTEDAARRGMHEQAGVEVEIISKLGEFASTSRKSTVYDAFLVRVTKELKEWKQGSEIERRWMAIDDAIAEMEDNSSIRIL
eukprot:CAMPEP_0184707510 /NCGR_PEP_ID=MMETSP0313-20130426/37306_1 /TAXON_ID=2792 /ORGANISM="Porphyridium aerugineum, Strain SAG 1380-2" /LENGTH=436 /DNA_ID=CAMNT_0027169085 /DNA_START=104 /DNA_END=1410 /DNA_ORIENTATION=-